jgi:copper chaperone
MNDETIFINGMSCGHCVMAVRKELESVPGLAVREVTVGRANITYEAGAVTPEAIDRAVAAAGYTVTGREQR